jgi:hypothetical protein
MVSPPSGNTAWVTPGLRGHLHITLQHGAVERIAGIAADEKGAHGLDQLLQGPDARPLADGKGERGPLGGEEGHQHVIHVAAVVHDKDDGRLAVDAGQAVFVDEADAHPVQGPRRRARHRIADAVVDVGVEGGHDLARIVVNAAPDITETFLVRIRMFGGSGLHPGIVEQAVDQHLAARQFEAWQLDRQLAADLAHHQLDATAEEPAHARHQQHHQHGPGGQGGEDHEGPQRYRRRTGSWRLRRR